MGWSGHGEWSGDCALRVESLYPQTIPVGRRKMLALTLYGSCIGHYIPSYLATITNGVLVSPSGTMTLTSGSNQWYERCQETPFDPTAPARPLQSGYSHVHGKLQTSKMAKIETLTPSPPATLKQIFGKTNHVWVFGGSFWTFSHREIQINRTFFRCVVSLRKNQKLKWIQNVCDAIELYFRYLLNT